MAHRNFARGAAPPHHSWEWVGVAKPPGAPTPQKGQPKPGTPVVIATMSETIVVEKKRRPWLWGLGGAVVGFLLGHKTARY